MRFVPGWIGHNAPKRLRDLAPLKRPVDRSRSHDAAGVGPRGETVVRVEVTLEFTFHATTLSRPIIERYPHTGFC
jgi:hypothetical protein